MKIYSFYEDHSIRRRYLRGGVASLVPEGQKHRRCSLCDASLDYPPPESHWNNIYIMQGSFVSSILWGWEAFHVTEALKDAFQKEEFEGIAFEPTVIVEDERPSKDKKKLPFDQIPQFYRVKLLTGIPQHQDYLELYGTNTSCPECGRSNLNSKVPRTQAMLNMRCNLDYLPPEACWNNVYINQGSFVDTRLTNHRRRVS